MFARGFAFFRLTPLRLPLVIAATYFVCSQLLRWALAWTYRPNNHPPGLDYVKMVAAGIHIDSVVALCLVTPVAVWQLLKKQRWTDTPLSHFFLRAGLLLAWAIGVFNLASEWFFFDEFQSRFNTVAIDYLIYPHEVMTNLWESFNLPLILSVVAVVAVTFWWFNLKLGKPSTNVGCSALRRWSDVAKWTALIVVGCLSISTHETSFSHERTINELANNGIAAGMRAALTRNLDYAAFYPSMDRREAFLHVRKMLASPGATFTASEPPVAPLPGPNGKLDPEANDAWVKKAAASLQRSIAGDSAKPKLNVCILLQESLGSEFWGCLGRTDGGKPATCTPKLDRLTTEEGMLFDNLFADGNRTIRGIEGVMSSFPPLPGDSILARDRTENVESAARVFKRDGYETLFLYSGKGTFDYIESYSLPNGWDRLIQEWDFKNVMHRTAWGVSDEDLYHRTIEEMRALDQAKKPFFVSCLGVSNHLPFTFPAKPILTDNSKTRKAAVRYADWAIWDFIRLAKREAFWQNTIFVIVADHGARVYGSQTIPSKSYMIPMYIVGGPVKHQRVSTLGCQLDVVPTVLGMIGRPYETMFFGHDLLAQTDPSQSRCVMHHNRSIAIYRDQRQVVFGLNKSIELFTGDPKSGNMEKVDVLDPIAEQLRQDGTALFQVADELYMHRAYRVQ